ncbi:MAG: hypothetical protein DRJ03_30160 [Chloroflexi bacterium]|nr:MAG: hypothetical protein DRJ03_30160 [Chloroflexota bacterium]
MSLATASAREWDLNHGTCIARPYGAAGRQLMDGIGIIYICNGLERDCPVPPILAPGLSKQNAYPNGARYAESGG